MGDREVDQQLVERAQKGDKHAFELLVMKYQRKLGRLLSRLVRDPAAAAAMGQQRLNQPTTFCQIVMASAVAAVVAELTAASASPTALLTSLPMSDICVLLLDAGLEPSALELLPLSIAP